LNLLDPEVTYELRELINQIATSKELKVIVFDSADPDFYIRHVDIVRAGETSTDEGPTGLRIIPDFLQRLAHLPVICLLPYVEEQEDLVPNLWKV
jgi:enoyl-CoA hydratase/carnithine racemase